METTRATIFDGLVGILRQMSAHDDAPITDATELYYNLGLAGDDLYEVINEIRDRFGTDFSQMKLSRYAPGEGLSLSLNMVRQFREWRGERTYRSLTVQSLVEAVEARRWNDR